MTDAPRDSRDSKGDPKAQLLLDSIIPYQINKLSYRMNRLLDQELRTHGLTIANWRIMAVLDYNPSITVNTLAHYAMLEQSTLSRILKQMEADGLLVNAASPKDRRVRAINLTDLGRARYDTVRNMTMTHVSRIVGGLNRAERAQLTSFVSRMQKSLDGDE